VAGSEEAAAAAGTELQKELNPQNVYDRSNVGKETDKIDIMQFKVTNYKDIVEPTPQY
jgi:hypothetical protein